MLYKVTSGLVEETHYGLDLARAANFPKRFMEVAEAVSTKLENLRKAQKDSSESRKLVRRRKLITNLHEMLKQANESDMDDAALASYLLRLRREFVLRMSALDEFGTDEGLEEHGDAVSQEEERIEGVSDEFDDDFDEDMMSLVE